MCPHLKYFAHFIQYSTLWSSEKRPVRNTQSASCPLFFRQIVSERNSSVNARNWWSDRWSWIPAKHFHPSFLKDQEEHSTQADWFLDLVACLIFPFSELPQQIFCKTNSWFSLFLHREQLAVGSVLAQGWYLMLGEPQESERRKINSIEWWLIAGLHQSRMAHKSSKCVLWG